MPYYNAGKVVYRANFPLAVLTELHVFECEANPEREKLKYGASVQYTMLK